MGSCKITIKTKYMITDEIQEFARLLVQNVRDSAIKSCDMQLQPNANSPIAKRWREAKINSKIDNLPEMMIPDCVDETVFYLLQAIDQGILDLSFKSVSGKVVNLSKEGLGELSGWYMGSGGWRSEHSEQRYIDDFADL